MTYDAGTAFLEILPKVGAGFSSDLSRNLTAPISAEGKKISAAISKSLTLGKVVAIGAFAGIADAAFKGMASAVHSTETFGAAVLALHRNLGLGATDASELEVILEHFGISSDQAAASLGIFNKNVQNGSKYAKEYGISTVDAAGHELTFTQILGEAADAYVRVGGGMAGAALAQNLFGRGARNLIPVLQLGSQGIADLAAEAQKYGLVLTQGNIDAIHKYELAQKDMALANTGLKVSIGTQLIPVLTKLEEILTAGVQVFTKIPGPIKAVALAAVGLGGSMVALGIAAGIVRTALGNLGIGLGKVATEEAAATASTDALAASEGAAAVASGGFATALLGLGAPIAGVVAVSLVAAETAKKMAAGVDEASQTVKRFGPDSQQGQDALTHMNATLDLTRRTFRGTSIDARGLGDDLQKTITDLKGMPTPANNTVGPLHKMAAALDNLTPKLKALAISSGVGVHQVGALMGAVNRFDALPRSTGKAVTDAIMAAGRNAKYASDHVQTLRYEIVQLPNGKIVKIAVPGLAAVRASLRGLHSEVEAIAGQYGISFVVSTHGTGPAGYKLTRFAEGGVIDEPILGIGQRTGKRYLMGENGKEDVIPRGKVHGAESLPGRPSVPSVAPSAPAAATPAPTSEPRGITFRDLVIQGRTSPQDVVRELEWAARTGRI